jgi:hypothetical protein
MHGHVIGLDSVWKRSCRQATNILLEFICAIAHSTRYVKTFGATS